MHSHDYRHPEVFTGKHLVILGAGPSGVDICLNVANCAEKVYLSHKRIKDFALNFQKMWNNKCR